MHTHTHTHTHMHGINDFTRLLLDNGAVTTLPDSNGQLLSCPTFCGIQFLLESRRKEQMDRSARNRGVEHIINTIIPSLI